jgi:hypothetical protein
LVCAFCASLQVSKSISLIVPAWFCCTSFQGMQAAQHKEKKHRERDWHLQLEMLEPCTKSKLCRSFCSWRWKDGKSTAMEQIPN